MTTRDEPFEEMKRWIGYTPIDSDRLRALLPSVTPRIPAVVEHFYEHVLASPAARAVLKDDSQIDRLSQTLQVWLRELLEGPHDQAYLERRERIGRRHVQVGLAARYMFTAMSVVQADLIDIAHQVLPPEEASATARSLQRVCQLDLAIMTGTYVEGRERLQLEVLQNLLIRHLRVSVILVGAFGEVVAATPATQGIFDKMPAVDQPWEDAVPRDLRDAADLPRHVERALATGREVTLLRVDVERSDGPRNFRVHVIPLDNPQALFLLQVEELTDVVSLEGRLRRNEALVQLGSLSAAIAHELRNPLAGISGAIQVIARSLPEDAPYRPIMGKVNDEVRRLNSLVTDLLAFAKPGSATLTQVDLGAVARDTVGLFRAEWPALVISVRGEGMACADDDLVRQILLNFLTNAAQAIDGPGQILVDVTDAALRVSDDGPGVPPERVGTIFEPFFTTKTRGTGLGLAISQRSARAMQASVALTSGGALSGACFTLVTLPTGNA